MFLFRNRDVFATKSGAEKALVKAIEKKLGPAKKKMWKLERSKGSEAEKESEECVAAKKKLKAAEERVSKLERFKQRLLSKPSRGARSSQAQLPRAP